MHFIFGVFFDPLLAPRSLLELQLPPRSASVTWADLDLRQRWPALKACSSLDVREEKQLDRLGRIDTFLDLLPAVL
jgi:hypothetical protein